MFIYKQKFKLKNMFIYKVSTLNKIKNANCSENERTQEQKKNILNPGWLRLLTTNKNVFLLFETKYCLIVWSNRCCLCS